MSLRNLIALGLLLLAASGVAASTVRVSTHRVPLAAMMGAAYPAWLAALGLAALLTLLCLARLRRERRVPGGRGAARRSGGATVLYPLRAAFVAVVASGAAYVALFPAYEQLWLELWLGPASGLFALLLLARGRLEGGRVDFAVFHACLALVLAEGGLRVAGRLTPSPLLAQPSTGPWRYLERQVLRPGSLWHGFEVNADGHYDEPFEAAATGERVVATVGDSFSIGLVHHALHYTTVAEGSTGLRIDNYGAPGIGPLEYLDLIRLVVAPRRPDLVVVSLYVGNDMHTHRPGGGRDLPRLATWLDRPNLLVYQVPRRKLRARGQLTGQVFNESSEAFADVEEYRVASPWVDDPLRERPTFDAETYLAMVHGKVRTLGLRANGIGPLNAIDRMRAACAPAPLAVMLIPDEFQVEDGLWDEVCERWPELAGIERDRPQRLLLEGLSERGVPCLDLLPVLRGVPPLDDGDRHLYHLRDTHWNARGNRVAGEALATFLEGLLGAAPAPGR